LRLEKKPLFANFLKKIVETALPDARRPKPNLEAWPSFSPVLSAPPTLANRLNDAMSVSYVD